MFEQQGEILFFEKETPIMEKPPNSDTNPACGTPNPPPWCDPNSTNVDMYLLILVVVAILIRLNFKSK